MMGHWLHFLAVLGLMASGRGDVDEECPFIFNVDRSIKNLGFHRNVDYYFELVANGDVTDCKVCFKQFIPNGLYVNKDQLTELVRLGRLSASVDGPVDVEAPADQATAHKVHLHAQLTPMFNILNATVTLPVHTRYHEARKDGGFEEVILPPPEVFVSCSFIPDSCKSHETSISSCAAVSDANDYYAVKHEMNDKSSEILIPLGNSSHYEIVQLFTFVVTWAGSKFIYYTLLKNKPRDV